jgi:tRNA-specific 2-thiouridylase
MEPVPARIGEQGEIIFETPQHGVAPGQACVVYAGSRVLGGGWIEKTHRSQGSEIRHPKEAHSAFAAA